jgi:hypothetical protein
LRDGKSATAFPNRALFKGVVSPGASRMVRLKVPEIWHT